MSNKTKTNNPLNKYKQFLKVDVNEQKKDKILKQHKEVSKKVQKLECKLKKKKKKKSCDKKLIRQLVGIIAIKIFK